MFLIVAMLSLLRCVEGACSLGGRRDTAQPHARAAASAMPELCWQAYVQLRSIRRHADLNRDRLIQPLGVLSVTPRSRLT